MTGNKCLLDTSVIIHSFKSNNIIGKRLDDMAEIYVPVAVIGELYYGAYKSASAEKHIKRIETFLSYCRLLPIDITIATIYGKVKASLTKKGKPIPENDIWIAATAIRYTLPLYTTDKHFSEIEDIILL